MRKWKMTSSPFLCLLLVGSLILLSTYENDLSGQDDPTDVDLSAGILLAPKAFRAAAAKVLPSLVTIDSFGGVGAVQGRIGGIRRQGEGSTTGIIVSKDGYVVTSSFNFIQKPPIITLTTSDGKKHLAKPVANDNTRKLTLLKIESEVESLPVPVFLAPADVEVGQWAISVGIGFGDANPAISAGIVSAKNRAFGRAIQTDANISPANYGGPLLDIQGRVIGVCVPLNPKSTSLASGVEWYDSGIGFAIPLNDRSILEALKKGKDVYPAFLGVQAKPAKLDGSGVKVVKIVNGSPAEKAGLKKDDLLLQIGDFPVQDMTQFKTLIGRFDAEQSTEIRFMRDQKEQTVEVTFSKPGPLPKKPVTGAKSKSVPDKK